MLRQRRLCLLFAFLTSGALGQWLNYPDPRTPRTKDGKPNLAAPVPRLQGKPDLSGVWQAERTPEREFATLFGDDFPRLQIDPQDFTKNVINVFAGLKPEEVPLRPEGVAALKRLQGIPDHWPHTQCLPAGIPADMLVLALKLIQTPREIVILTEIASPPRQIHTDGRPLPKDPDPSWMGYSIGKWEGDALVVETAGLKDGWLDGFGHPAQRADADYRAVSSPRFRPYGFGVHVQRSEVLHQAVRS
jgi:hypothetical protein